MTVLPPRRSCRVATRRSWRWLAVAAALTLPAHPATAEDLEWQPLTTVYTTTRTAIEVAVTPDTMAVDLGDPRTIQVAFAELSEPAGDVAAESRPEIFVWPAPAACTQERCRIEILADDHGTYAGLTSLYASSLALGTAFRHGMRDLLVDGHRYRFDGIRYLYTGALGAWWRLTEVDAATRAWFEEEQRRTNELFERDDPARVSVAFVELHDEASAGPERHRDDLVIYNRNVDWCGTGGCAIMVYGFDGQGYTPLAYFLGYVIDLGSGFSHGLRDLVVDDVPFRFDGRHYVFAESRPGSAE